MRLALRSLLCLVTVLLVLALLSPWLLYELGLQLADGLPTKPAQMASAEQQARVWRHARGIGEPLVEPMNPYGFAWRFVSADFAQPSGETVAYWVAREHISAQPQRGMLRWHLSNAALAIWLTRHWSTDELLSAAVPVVDRDMEYRARRAVEAAAEDQAPARSRAASAM